MHSDHIFTNTVKELGRRNNIDISLVHGATVLTTDANKEIWLESPRDSAFVIVHTAVMEKVSFAKQLDLWEKCMTLNSESAALGGGWLCRHEQTDTLRYCFTLPKKFVDLAVLDEALINTAKISQDFENNLRHQKKASVNTFREARV